MRYLFLLSCLLFVSLTPVVASDELEADAINDEPFVDVLDVEVVNIDVWVTDKEGQPVTDLEREDFIVLRDGTPVEISNYYVVREGREVNPDPLDVLGEEEVDQRPPSLPLLPNRDLEVAPEHKLWLIVLVDNFNSDPIERNRVFPAVHSFLKRTVRGGDEAMLVSYTRSLEVHQPFTDDSDLLLGALHGLKKSAGLAEIRSREQMETMSRIDQSDSASQALLFARQYAEEQMNSVEYTVDALERLIDSLAGLPGRKAIVHVSSGIPMLAGEEMFHAVAEKFNTPRPYAEIGRHDTSRSFERVDRLANANRVTFYTVDAGGLKGLEFGSAEYGGFVNSKFRRTLDSIVPENLQAPLRLMALETGGKAIVNQNNILPALVSAAEDFRSFYSLGIQSADASTGRYHQIKVKLKEPRKGVKLRHRAGYRSKDSETRIREALRSALFYEGDENPLNFEVSWNKPQPTGERGDYILPMTLRIPLKSAVLLPTSEGRHEARMKMFVGVVDSGGGISPIDVAPLGIRLEDQYVEAAKNEAFLYNHQLRLSPGTKKVGIAILDLFSFEASIVTDLVQIGTPAQNEPEPEFTLR